MPVSRGLVFAKGLKVGMDELQWWQFENGEVRRRERLAHSRKTGLVMGNALGAEQAGQWRAHDANDDGTITVSVGPQGHALAIDSDGYALQLYQDIELALTDDNTWYTLVLRRGSEDKERGTITFTVGSTSITGIGTEFTRYHGFTSDAVQDMKKGTRIKITGSALGNDGIYELDTVATDTTATMRTAPLGNTEAGLTFSVVGDFSIATPADPDIHERIKPALVEVARTRVPAAGDMIICDTKRNDAGGPPKVQIIDRRHANRWRPQHEERGLTWLELRTNHHSAGAGDYLSTELNRQAVWAPASSVTDIDGAPAASNGSNVRAVMVAGRPGGPEVRALTLSRDSRSWAAAGVVQGAGADGPCAIEAVPPSTGNTHVCVYLKAGIAYLRPSTDNGATWGAEVKIWDPTLIAAADLLFGIDLLLTRRGRLILGAVYGDASQPVGQQYGISYVYSDDYGSTWTTNAHAGFTILDAFVSSVEATQARLAQTDDGTIWWVFIENNPLAKQKIRVKRSVNEDLPDAASTAGGTVVGEQATADKYDVCAWAAPGGGLAVVYGRADTAKSHYAQILVGATSDDEGALTFPTEIYRDESWLRITDAAHVAAAERIRIIPTLGFPWVVFIDTKPVVNVVDGCEVMPVRLGLPPSQRFD